jgi:hypothetical protein
MMPLNKRSSAISLIIVTLIAFGNVEAVHAQSANVEALKAQMRQRTQQNAAKAEAAQRQRDAAAAAERRKASAAIAAGIAERQRAAAAEAAAEAAAAARDYARIVKLSKMTKKEYDAFILAENNEKLHNEISPWIKSRGNVSIKTLTFSDINQNPWMEGIILINMSDYKKIQSKYFFKQNDKLILIKELSPSYYSEVFENIDQDFNNLFKTRQNYVNGGVETIKPMPNENTQKIASVSDKSKLDVKIICGDYTIQEYNGSPPFCSGHGGYLKMVSGAELAKYERLANDFALGSTKDNSFLAASKNLNTNDAATPTSGDAGKLDPSDDFSKRYMSSPKWVRPPERDDFELFYPIQAQWAGVEGLTTFSCVVATSGYLKNCAVKTETPANLNFRDATLSVANLWKMEPLIADGIAVESTWIGKIHWSIVGPVGKPIMVR